MNRETASPKGSISNPRSHKVGMMLFSSTASFGKRSTTAGRVRSCAAFVFFLLKDVEDDPFVRRVLVNQNKAVGSFQKDERVRKLADNIEAGVGKFRRVAARLPAIRIPAFPESPAGPGVPLRKPPRAWV